jgi:hypothetical protein
MPIEKERMKKMRYGSNQDLLPDRMGDGLPRDMSSKFMNSIPTSLYRAGANVDFSRIATQQTEPTFEVPENAVIQPANLYVENPKIRHITEHALSRVNYEPMLKRWKDVQSSLSNQPILERGYSIKTSESAAGSPFEPYNDGSDYFRRNQLGLYAAARGGYNKNKQLSVMRDLYNRMPITTGFEQPLYTPGSARAMAEEAIKQAVGASSGQILEAWEWMRESFNSWRGSYVDESTTPDSSTAIPSFEDIKTNITTTDIPETLSSEESEMVTIAKNHGWDDETIGLHIRVHREVAKKFADLDFDITTALRSEKPQSTMEAPKPTTPAPTQAATQAVTKAPTPEPLVTKEATVTKEPTVTTPRGNPDYHDIGNMEKRVNFDFKEIIGAEARGQAVGEVITPEDLTLEEQFNRIRQQRGTLVGDTIQDSIRLVEEAPITPSGLISSTTKTNVEPVMADPYQVRIHDNFVDSSNVDAGSEAYISAMNAEKASGDLEDVEQSVDPYRSDISGVPVDTLPVAGSGMEMEMFKAFAKGRQSSPGGTLKLEEFSSFVNESISMGSDNARLVGRLIAAGAGLTAEDPNATLFSGKSKQYFVPAQAFIGAVRVHERMTKSGTSLSTLAFARAVLGEILPIYRSYQIPGSSYEFEGTTMIFT